MRRFALLSIPLAIASCGGSNVTYFQVLGGQATAPTGTNCPSCTTDGCETSVYTGIEGVGTWAIYTAPSAQYLLDDGSGNLYVGTLASGTYTFTGVYENDETANNANLNTTTKLTVEITTSGDGFTGTETLESSCVGSNCSGGASSGGFDCITSTPVTGVQLSGVSQETSVASQAPSSPNGASNNGGCNATCPTGCNISTDCTTCIPTSSNAGQGTSCQSSVDCCTGTCQGGVCS
jgi:hypothetical protein